MCIEVVLLEVGDEMTLGLATMVDGVVEHLYILRRPGLRESVSSHQHLLFLSHTASLPVFLDTGYLSSAMSRFTPYLVSALAVATPFVHCIAVPATPLQAVPDKFLQVRDPIAFAAPVQIGDLLSFHNGQLLRRANETAPSEVFARESFSDSLDKRAVIVKRNDPVWPQPMPIKDEWEEEGIIDCGDIGKICIGEAGIKLGKGSAGDVFKAIDERKKIIAVKLFDVEKARDLEYDNSKKVDDDANIVDILAKCKKFGSKFPIAMELVEGESLQKRIDSKVYASKCTLRFTVIRRELMSIQSSNPRHQ
jgi:hypothetical protein